MRASNGAFLEHQFRSRHLPKGAICRGVDGAYGVGGAFDRPPTPRRSPSLLGPCATHHHRSSHAQLGDSDGRVQFQTRERRLAGDDSNDDAWSRGGESKVHHSSAAAHTRNHSNAEEQQPRKTRADRWVNSLSRRRTDRIRGETRACTADALPPRNHPRLTSLSQSLLLRPLLVHVNAYGAFLQCGGRG